MPIRRMRMMDGATYRLPAELLREAYPRDVIKLTARGFGVAWNTARKWLDEGIPASRRRTLIRVLDDAIAACEARRQRLETELARLEHEEAMAAVADSAAPAGGERAAGTAPSRLGRS